MKCNLGQTEELSVGKLFELSCQSDSSTGPEFADLNPEKIELRLSKEDQYKLKIIKAEKFSPNEMKLTLTSYKAGEHQLKAVQLIEGEHSYVLGDLQFTVKSVINPQEPPTEPYSSLGPMQLHLPLWYWFAAAGLIVLVGFQVYWEIRQRAQKKKLLRKMQIDSFASTPQAQFFQSLRKLQRNYAFFSGGVDQPEQIQNFVEDLDQAYKLYLARLYRVPTFYWSQRKILSEIRSVDKTEYAELKNIFRKGLAELSRAQKAKGVMSGQDLIQLNNLIRKQVDEIESVRKDLQSKRTGA